jgi:hypothetical protein
MLERLEDRLLPSNYTAANVSQLIADINAANQQGGANTITLTAPTSSPYILTAQNNLTNGPTGLPVIAANDNLTIAGNGDIIERSTAKGTPGFRLFNVAAGASLTLENVTLQGGAAYQTGASAVSAEGGAIYSLGTLVLNDVRLQDNTARGLNLPAAGGALYVGGGTATLTGDTVVNNTAWGALGRGDGTRAGLPAGLGAGVFVASGGTVTLTDDTIEFNSDNAKGAGLFILGGGIAYLDAYTVQHTIENTAPVEPNIYGSYTLIS